jgi:hypothetical protein
MAQTVEICLPNLAGFVEGNAPMIFFTPLNVREVELRAYMEGWEANCVDGRTFGSIGGAKADLNQAEDLSTAGFLASSGPAI